MLLGIDPGTTESAWLLLDGMSRPVDFGVADNAALLAVIAGSGADTLAIEMVASYGMPVGREVFETCVWSGRFVQRWLDSNNGWKSSDGVPARAAASVRRVYRRDVKLHLCGSSKAKDANIRQALIDLYGPGKDAAIGRKASPGPLYGISSHVWAALAVAVTAVALP